MRVSDQKRQDIVTARINQAKEANAQALEQLSTQKRINRISDDPIGNTAVINVKFDIANKRQFQRNVDFALGFLEQSEATMSQINEKLIRAKELAVGMANDTNGPENRQAVSLEIREIIAEVIGLGNTSFGNRYIFSGFRTQTPAFGADGEYTGDDGKIFLPVGKDNLRQVNIPGRALFEAAPDEQAAGHFNLIDSLKILHEGLETNDKHQISAALNELDHQMTKVTSFQASVGSIQGSLEGVRKQLEIEEEEAVKQRSKIEDSDIYKASSDFKQTESVLQTSLLASNKLLQPSLLNYMQ